MGRVTRSKPASRERRTVAMEAASRESNWKSDEEDLRTKLLKAFSDANVRANNYQYHTALKTHAGEQGEICSTGTFNKWMSGDAPKWLNAQMRAVIESYVQAHATSRSELAARTLRVIGHCSRTN